MSETVEDILREMRNREDMPLDGFSQLEAYQMMQSLADRIEAAYKNLPGMWIVPAENAKLREENARLKAALKPVSECSIEKFKPGYETYAVEPFYTSAERGVEDAEGDAIQNESIATALNAIREAQRIYNGGAK